jgi:hypothetical protein
MPRRSGRVDSPRVSDAHDPTRYRGLSVSFDPTEAEWIGELVATLKEQGYTKARRSKVVRVALLVLQDALAGRTREEIFRFFIQRDLDRLARLVSAPPRQPSE